MNHKGCCHINHGKASYGKAEGILTMDFIDQVAKSIKPGDRITWMVPCIDLDRLQAKDSMKKARLTVTGKTKYLIIARDDSGRMHTIRIAELAMDRWNKKKRRAGRT